MLELKCKYSLTLFTLLVGHLSVNAQWNCDDNLPQSTPVNVICPDEYTVGPAGFDGGISSLDWILVYDEEFEGNRVEEADWKIQEGVLRDYNFESSKQFYTRDNLSVSNGTLKMNVSEYIPPAFLQYYDDDQKNNVYSYFDYASSEIESKYHFTYGRAEINCDIAGQKGYFPAFWMFGGMSGWNELDVFEFWDNQWNQHQMNMWHEFVSNSGTEVNCSFCNKPGVGTSNGYHTAFHKFSAEWTPLKTEWFVDGVKKRYSYRFYGLNTLPLSPVPVGIVFANNLYNQMKYYPRDPMRIIVGTAVENGNNAPDGTTDFSDDFEIRSIKYYMQIPCNSLNTITQRSDINLQSEVYDFQVGTNVHINGNLTVSNTAPTEHEALHVIAENQIKILGDFVVELGAYFRARIDPDLCQNVSARMSSSRDEEDIDSSNLIPNTSETSPAFSILPNPTNGKFRINLNSNESADVYVQDMLGNIVFQKKQVLLDQSDLSLPVPSGIYLVIVNLNGQLHTEKLIVE